MAKKPTQSTDPTESEHVDVNVEVETTSDDVGPTLVASGPDVPALSGAEQNRIEVLTGRRPQQ